MSEQLNPCPFCDSEPEIYRGDVGYWHVVCAECGCQIASQKSREIAEAAWNRRQPQKDAQRYRFLRTIEGADLFFATRANTTQLDALVDAAMKIVNGK